MKEFWEFEGPAPAIPEGVWDGPEGLSITPAKRFPGSAVVPVERARKVPRDIREPRPARPGIVPFRVRSVPWDIRGPAKAGVTAIPVVRARNVPKDIRDPAREGSRLIPVVHRHASLRRKERQSDASL